MKFKDILDKKVIYSENLGDEYYYDYRIIVQISKNRVVLIEYNDSGSGYIPFSVQSVDKEFISSFFVDYHNGTRKILLQLGSTTTLQEEIDFKNYQEYLDEDISILDFEDIKDYVTMNFDLGPIDYEAAEKLCQENITTEEAIDKLKHTLELHTLFFGDAGGGQLEFNRLLNELNKKDKIIDAMAEKLAGIIVYDFNKHKPVFLKTKEGVKQYFEQEVKHEIKS